MASTYYFLSYDIPDVCPLPNPSGYLRRRAIRINLSDWVIPEGRIPWNMLDRYREAGASWHLVQFASDEAPKLLELALSALRKEVADTQTRLQRSLDRAEQRHVEETNILAGPGAPVVGTVETPDTARDYRRRTRAALRRAALLLGAAADAAAGFGIDQQTFGLAGAVDAVSALQSSAHARAAAYASMAERAAETLLGPAAADSDVPAPILADYLDERGDDVSAARVAFADPPPNVAV